MIYPLISEYIEAIRYAEDNFDELNHLRPVLDGDGNPVMSSGNFAVVFKMTDGQKDYAIKCFTREQEGREEAYRLIAEELDMVSSSFLCPIRYFEKELFVDTQNSSDTEFPVLQMDWVDGVTLDNFVRNNLYDKYELECLAYNFCRMAQWMLTQPFAHGDLKPDNILVQSDGSLVLVDYDGMFVPAMKGEKARELGSPNYRHPLRTEEQFDEHIDDFALASIAVALKAIALKPGLYNEFGSADRILFSEGDSRNLGGSKVVAALQALMADTDFLRLYGLFMLAYSEQSLSNVSFRLFQISKPVKPAVIEIFSTEVTDEDLAEAWEDEFGVKYSKDGKRLLKANLNEDVHEYIIKGGTEIICDRALQLQGNGISLNKIILPESVKAIGAVAFANNEELSSINIPKAVRQIQSNNPFGGCFRLCKIDIQSKYLIKENNFIFSFDRKILFSCIHAVKVNHVVIPNGVETISANAFWNALGNSSEFCKFASINIPNSVASIGDKAFCGCASLQNITIPNSVASIGDDAFVGCVSLQNITIPNSVTSIGDNAFVGCVSLQSINIPNSVASIGDNAFVGCVSLQNITIPNSVTSIGGMAFAGCASSQNITIPNSVASIGDNAFTSCKSLQSINIPNSVTRIGDGVFIGCNIQIESDSPQFYSDECCLIDLSSHRLLSCHRADLKKYSMPHSVTSIGDSAFDSCHSLQSINIADTVTSIGHRAFYSCESLQSINIPNSVTSIGNWAFESCESLQSIFIPRHTRSKFEALLPKYKEKLVETDP